MTSQKDQIQSLIVDIEQVLGATKPRKPWIRASETEPQRQALARAKDYLRSLQEAFDAPGGWGPVDPSTGQVAGPSAEGRQRLGGIFSEQAAPQQLAPQQTVDSSAEDVLQALLTEMKFLRSSALEPLRLEMNSLREQRDSLQQEVLSLAEERRELDRLASSGASSGG